MLVREEAKLKEHEKEELNDMWKGVFVVELKGLEATLVNEKIDHKELKHLPHELAFVEHLECLSSHPESQGLKWRWEASQGVCQDEGESGGAQSDSVT